MRRTSSRTENNANTHHSDCNCNENAAKIRHGVHVIYKESQHFTNAVETTTHQVVTPHLPLSRKLCDVLAASKLSSGINSMHSTSVFSLILLIGEPRKLSGRKHVGDDFQRSYKLNI